LKRILILFLVSILTISFVPAAQAGSFHDKGMMVFENVPEVYINTSTNQSFNISYVSAIVSNGNLQYFFHFNSAKWGFKQMNKDESVYTATLHAIPFPSGMGGGMYYNFSGSQGQNLFSREMKVKILIERMESRIPNSTITAGSLQITIDLSSSSFVGAGNISLFQFVGGRGDHGIFGPNAYSFTTLNNSIKFINITGEKVSAYYWWPDYYLVNGRNMTMQVTNHYFMGYSVLSFGYSFDNSFNITQDPYFSVPSFNILNHTVVYRAIGAIGNFIYEHIEFLGAGLATGVALLGASYAYYRKRRL